MNNAGIVTIRKPSRPRKDKRDATSRANVRREFELANSVLSVLTKRIVTASTLSTNGAGLIVATTIANSNGVSVLGDFASLAAIYSNYRVKAIKVTAKPFVNAYTTTTYVTPMIAVIPFRSGLVPSTFPSFIESSEVRLISGYDGGVFETSSKGYPDGQLWNPTNAVISTADSFGIAAMGQNYVAGSVSTYVWMLVTEYLCEFSVSN